MTLKKLITLAFVVLLAACALMVFSLYRVSKSKATIDQMQEMRGRSLILASELQQSSEDLTSLVRQFAVTGDENFARAYQDVVDVRAGKKSRPREREIAPGRTVSLTDLMREAGFTDSEFRLL